MADWAAYMYMYIRFAMSARQAGVIQAVVLSIIDHYTSSYDVLKIFISVHFHLKDNLDRPVCNLTAAMEKIAILYIFVDQIY